MKGDDVREAPVAVEHGTPVATSQQVIELIQAITIALQEEANSRLTQANKLLDEGNHAASVQAATVAKAFISLSKVTAKVVTQLS